MALKRNLFILLIIQNIFVTEVLSFRCDRKPYGSTTLASAPDGRFKLVVLGVDSYYKPEQLYTVQIIATDNDSTFQAFMISAEGESKSDPKNVRRITLQYPGELRPQSQGTARFSDRCMDSVEQATGAIKSSVEVYWQAPPSGSGCVTLRAMVAENEDVWYTDGTPLSQKLCEDMSQPDDVSPQFNYDCQICDEAKYEVTFTGIWSRNTHPRYFPENDWVPRYSDLVGASHAADFILWTPGSLASSGLRDLAEHANSSQFETEIKEKIGIEVRTLIKGKGHGYPKMKTPTYAFFRVDKMHHVVSVAVGLHPSPDWFLGVSRFELCQEDNTWLQERELNLYPWDAGTDSGISYESQNMETFPQDAVTRVQMSSYDKNSPFFEMAMKDMHPFGKLNIKIIRTYHRNCEEEPIESTTDVVTETTTTDDSTEPEIETNEPANPSRYQFPELPSSDLGGLNPEEINTEAPETCDMSPWQEWSLCEGLCENGKLIGYRWRQRYHLVDGVAVEKYDPDADNNLEKKEVPRYCKTHFDEFERKDCEENCTER